VKLKAQEHQVVPRQQQSADYYPKGNFVVSRRDDGTVVSRMRDMSWDMTALHSRGETTVFIFSLWGDKTLQPKQVELVGECKKILYLIYWKIHETDLAVQTLQNYFRLVRSMAVYCLQRNMSIANLLVDPEAAERFALHAGYAAVRGLVSLVSALRKLDSKQTGFACYSQKSGSPILKIRRDYVNDEKQYAPLPTRIYDKLISGLARELDEYEKIESDLMKTLEVVCSNSRNGRARNTQEKQAGSTLQESEFAPEFSEIASEELCRYLIAQGCQETVPGLVKAVTRIQFVCKLTIHVFSGMRDSEARYLPYACYASTVLDGTLYHLICGTTTKLENGLPKGVFWVTSQEGKRAVEVAQRICDAIAKSQHAATGDAKSSDSPLFLSTGYCYRNTFDSSGRPGTLDIDSHRDLLRRLDLFITVEDVEELELIDPHRAWWVEEEFAVGKCWPLQTHQLRRSLALYATASGLVELSSLRRQLQHITAAMSEYYAKGSASARNLLEFDRHHMCAVYQETNSESQALGYIRNVLLSPEPMLGPMGTWANRNILQQGILTVETRDDVMRRFEVGEISYTETYLGGCSQIEPCKRRAMRSLVSCINCGKAGIKLSRLDRVIVEQRVVVHRARDGSIEKSAEQRTLEDLVKARKELASKKD
jgi:hypothetical protein